MSVTLTHSDKKRISRLQNHGLLIRYLRCHLVDKAILQSIARHTPFLKTIHLTFDRRSLWVTPDDLEEAFLRLQDQLVTVSLLFDFYEVDLRWMELLKGLKGVKKLIITMSKYSEKQIYICAEVLNLCPGLEEFELVCGGVPVDLERTMGNVGGGKLTRLWTDVQRELISAIDRLPTILREFIGRQLPAPIAPSPPLGTSNQGTSITSTTALVQPIANPRGERHAISSLCDMYQHNTLRRLKMVDPSGYTLNFSCFAQHCPNLQEIDIHATIAWLQPSYWYMFSAACPQLRSLRVQFGSAKYDFSCHQHVFTLFPRLELLSVSSANLMLWSDWKSERYDMSHLIPPKDHPDNAIAPILLKSLHLRDCFGTLENLLGILSIKSPFLALETLIIGYPKEFREYSELATHPAEMEADIARKFGSIYYRFDLTSLPWNIAMKASLTRLDISHVVLLDANIVRIVFERLQELRNLRSLCVSAFHLRDWTPKDFFFMLPTYTTFTNLPSSHNDSMYSISLPTLVSTRSSLSDISTHQHDNPSILCLPKVQYDFPSLRDLIVEHITPLKKATPKGMTVSEVVYALAAMPGLEYFYPRGEACMEEEMLLPLRRVFPRQFMTIPEVRLNWLL